MSVKDSHEEEHIGGPVPGVEEYGVSDEDIDELYKEINKEDEEKKKKEEKDKILKHKIIEKQIQQSQIMMIFSNFHISLMH